VKGLGGWSVFKWQLSSSQTTNCTCTIILSAATPCTVGYSAVHILAEAELLTASTACEYVQRPNDTMVMEYVCLEMWGTRLCTRSFLQHCSGTGLRRSTKDL
jgi:hypothetical protein